MKFALFSLVMNLPNALTGETLTQQEKFQNVIKQAILAEKLGFEAYGIGERHGATGDPNGYRGPYYAGALVDDGHCAQRTRSGARGGR